MAPLKSLLLLPPLLASGQEPLACANENCEAGDQTALLQSHLSRKSELSLSATGAAFFPKLANLNDPHKRKEALLEMEKTAIKLANTEGPVEDPVVEICLATANMLNQTVLAAIIEEDAEDRVELQNGLDAFDEHEEKRQAAIDAILAAERAVEQAASVLVDCRREESEVCTQVEECHDIFHSGVCNEVHECWLCDHCTDLAVMEGTASLCCIDQKIHHRWCEGEGSDATIREDIEWRQVTRTLFEHYNAKEASCRTSHDICENITQNCTTIFNRYHNLSVECTELSTSLRAKSCEYHHSVGTALALYQQAYMMTLEAYEVIVARVMIGEADRKVEWEVLTRVICLLLSLTVGQGDAGAVSSETNQQRIQLCWDEEVDTTHLDIDYQEAPDMIDVPVLPPRPCEANFSVIYPIDPPGECTELVIDNYGSSASSECVCNAPIITQPELTLGHFLMIDPAIQVTITNGQTTWSTTFLDGTVHTGPISAIHRESQPALTEAFFTSDEQDEGNVAVAGVAWAYGSADFDMPASASLEQRFGARGGMLFLNSDDEVVAVRGLAPSASTLNQEVVAYLSFAVPQNLTDTQFGAVCPVSHPVVDAVEYDRGARDYCWVKGDLLGDTCVEGCFAYQLANGNKLVFPLIAGAFANSLVAS